MKNLNISPTTFIKLLTLCLNPEQKSKELLNEYNIIDDSVTICKDSIDKFLCNSGLNYIISDDLSITIRLSSTAEIIMWMPEENRYYLNLYYHYRDTVYVCPLINHPIKYRWWTSTVDELGFSLSNFEWLLFYIKYIEKVIPKIDSVFFSIDQRNYSLKMEKAIVRQYLIDQKFRGIKIIKRKDGLLLIKKYGKKFKFQIAVNSTNYKEKINYYAECFCEDFIKEREDKHVLQHLNGIDIIPYQFPIVSDFKNHLADSSYIKSCVDNISHNLNQDEIQLLTDCISKLLSDKNVDVIIKDETSGAKQIVCYVFPDMVGSKMIEIKTEYGFNSFMDNLNRLSDITKIMPLLKHMVNLINRYPEIFI